MTKIQKRAPKFKLPADHELDRILTMQEAGEVSTLSPDTLKRRHRDKIIKLSPRRLGMRLRDALNLQTKEPAK